MKYGCLAPAVRSHSYQPSAGTRHRRCANGTPNARDVVTVSARALIMRAAPEVSGDHAGTRPHLATVSTRATDRAGPPDGSERGPDGMRTIGTGSVGATL